MMKVGFRVSPIHHMGNTGEIVEIYYKTVTAETMGGTFSKRAYAKVRLDRDGSVQDYKVQDLMRLA